MMIAYLFIAQLVFANVSAARRPSPLVILPPYLKQNDTSSISITQVLQKNNVDLKLRILHGTQLLKTITERELKTGIPKALAVPLHNAPDVLDIKIEVSGHEEVFVTLPVRPDLFAVHIQTDKTIYKAGETVQVRALPLTSQGKIYSEQLEFILINSEGFELVRKSKSVELNPVLKEEFELPEHLFYGEWKVLARASGVTDPLLTFSANFQVKEYDLPAFKLTASIDDDSDIESTGISIDARYFHGAPINGTFIIFCSNNSAHESDHSALIKAKSSELNNGVWSSTVDMQICNKHDDYTQQVVIEVRDHGTGSRNDIKLLWDPLSPKFNIIPMRPFFAPSVAQLPLLVEGSPDTGEVWLSLKCIGNITSNIGEVSSELQVQPQNVAQFLLTKQWRSLCNVIRVDAKQKLKHGFSKTKTMFIPNLKDTSGKHFISIPKPQAVYEVGEQVNLEIQTTDNQNLSYLILCNGQTILRGDHNQKMDRKLSFKVSELMRGTCQFFIYSTETHNASDMILFRIKDKCQASMTLSKIVNGMKSAMTTPEDSIEPGDNVEIDFSGEPRGIAIYRAVDDRLNFMTLKNDIFLEKMWDFSMFANRKTKSYQTKILNLLDVSRVSETIVNQCSEAGKLMKPTCPTYSISSSMVSNVCLKYIIKECNPLPTEIGVISSCKTDSFCPNILRGASFMLKPAQRIQEIRRPDYGIELSSFNDNSVDEPHLVIRENFQEVWLFDTVILGSDGTATVRSPAPDNIGQWAVSSVFWNQGRISMCPTTTAHVQSKKSVFMNVDIPKEVYINETVSVRITVSALKIPKLTKFSICMPDLPRKICADEGSFGNRGKPAYSNVALTPAEGVVTKTFAMRFLLTGETTLTFMLREEASFPGMHHCDVGKILDVVKIKIKIAKRADTVEYYRRILLNSNKPVLKFADDVMPSEITEQPIEFLPTPQFFNEVQTRLKRGVFEQNSAFLSDVISSLSTELYRFKTLAQKKNVELYQLEWAQKRISSLISEMMRFSNCGTSGDPCGFAVYGRPSSQKEISVFFTSIATSLLCEASVQERMIIGALRTITEAVGDLINDNLPNDIREFLDIQNAYDRKFMLASVMYQVSKDCSAYQANVQDIQNSINEEFGRLYRIYYDFDETLLVDDRAVAAVSYMASNATQELLRIKMLETVDANREPFWSAGEQSNTIEKVSTFDILTSRRKKSGDTLVNSLGLLAFITAGAEGSKIDWDPLADWLFKQQREDGSFESPLDTYFASRALYEYRQRKVMIDHNSDVQVTVTCNGCPTRVINVTETSVEIHLPTNVKKMKLETSGVGKVKAEIRVVATRRQRLRRQLTQDDYYPVVITCDQQHFQRTTIQQTVCLRVLSPTIKKLEMTHGVFTSYSTNPKLLSVAENSTEIQILNEAKSSYAMHFLLTNLPFNKTVCYKVGITEPPYSHEPIYLAPVAIVARHPFNDVVGLLTIAHPDVIIRSKRSTDPHQFFFKRIRRAIQDRTSVDTVCFEGGVCSCAETSCSVQCKQCEYDTEENLHDYLYVPEHFGAAIRVKKVEKRTEDSAMYTTLTGEVYDKSGKGSGSVSDTLTVVIRECNRKCSPSSGEYSKNDKLLILGHIDGLVYDSVGTQNYVLRSTDRIEEATRTCKHLNTVITLKDD